MATESPTTGDNIAAEMKRRRISQQMLADHLHLSQAAISQRLRGVTDWRLAEITAVAALFDMPVTELIAGAEPTTAGAA